MDLHEFVPKLVSIKSQCLENSFTRLHTNKEYETLISLALDTSTS